jgi:dienelactone hydrolase
MYQKKIFLLAIIVSCVNVSNAQLAGFTLTGNPQSPTGASWTFQDTVNNVWYDLQGILFEPSTGTPPYPAVIINHGTGGNVNGYSRGVAMKMVQWGFVCIATNLCHSGGVPIGSPGDTSLANYGASTNNYLRAMKCWDILASLNYVDTNCILSFGHSRGAFTTTGLVASYPDKFICAGHTAGGASPLTGFTAPSTSLAAQVICPYIIHHGDADSVVPIAMDSLLNDVFDTTGITHQFYVYPGFSHSQMSMDSVMFVRTQDWFVNHSCLSSAVVENETDEIFIFPNPVMDELIVRSSEFGDNKIRLIEIYDMLGQEVFHTSPVPLSSGRGDERGEVVNVTPLAPGIYFVILRDGQNNYATKKFVKQ